MKSFKTVFSALLICVALLCFAVYAEENISPEADIQRTIIEPTCLEPGYILIENNASATTNVENLPALGHDFGNWIPDPETGIQTRECAVCKHQESIRISTIPEEAFPTLRLTGSMDGIGKKQKVALEAEFSGEGNSFSCYAIMTLQGHSTFGYPKRNYTVRFYDDDQSISKHKLQFRNWNPEHKYILKANYYDLSQCRNLVSSSIWSDMAASRDNLSRRLASLPTYGAVDGFPVNVYLNDEYFGLYTLNLHKDDDLYQMKDGERSALVICNHQSTDESLFRAQAAFLPDYTSDWEIEFCGTENEQWVRDSFNGLIEFVMDSSDKNFRKKIGKYLDVDAAIDYLIFIYSFGMPDSAAKDMVMLNFGDKWIPSAYDMDSAFGFDPENGRYAAPDEFIPCKTGSVWESGTRNLLWDRILNNFEEEFCSRYAYLRRSVLSEENVLAQVDNFIGSVPEAFYDMDYNLYSGRPLMDTNMESQIKDYVIRRFEVLDGIMEVDGYE